MFCSNCGKEIPDGSKFCSICGTPISGEVTAASADGAVANVIPTNGVPANVQPENKPQKKTPEVIEKVKNYITENKKKSAIIGGSVFAAIIIIVVLAFCVANRDVLSAKMAIGSIGKVTIDSENKITAAREKYNKVPKAKQSKVSNYKTLEKAEKEFSPFKQQLADIESVKNKIKEIGTVTAESTYKITAAREAYDKLPEENKKRVDNYDVLEKAEAENSKLRIEKANSSIDAIGEVTLERAKNIEIARNAVNNLSDDEKKSVANLAALEAAEKKLSELKAEKVIKLIDEIGEVTLDSEGEIKKASEEFNKLSDAEKTLVKNEKVLNDANSTYEELEKQVRREKLQAALTSMNTKYDKVRGITWYEPKVQPKYINVRSYFLPYIGKYDKQKDPFLRVKSVYMGDDWVFYKNLTIMVDGEKYFKHFSYYDVDRDNGYGDVWEVADFQPDKDDIEMLKAIANSNETIIRFEGDNHYEDYTVPAGDKAAIKAVIEAYENWE